MSGLQKFDATPVRPSTPAYAPGTVAVATVHGVPGVRVFRSGDGWQADRWVSDATVTDVRPLVVIDPADVHEEHSAATALRLLPEWVRIAAHKADAHDRDGHLGMPAGHGDILRSIADQIERQTRPKPPEPTGDGAVVEDVNGHRWVRIAGPEPERESKPWRHRGHTARTWEHVNAVRVLSEGVQ